jgi:hypothetical protein
MSKSVFQQLVEQTCSQANFKPSNNKAAQQPKNGKPNGSAKSVPNPSGSAVGSQSPITNHKSPIARPEVQSAKPRNAVAEIIARQIHDMDAANKAPRCQHIKANGVRCKSPAMRELPFCFFHEKFYNPPYDDSFPPLEDANSVQCAILQVLNGLKTKSITVVEARAMLYGLKAASINSRRTTFEPIMQAQVTEYPSSLRQQRDSPEKVVIPNPQGEGPAVSRAAALNEFLQAAKQQSSVSEVAKPPASTTIPEVVLSKASGTAH